MMQQTESKHAFGMSNSRTSFSKQPGDETKITPTRSSCVITIRKPKSVFRISTLIRLTTTSWLESTAPRAGAGHRLRNHEENEILRFKNEKSRIYESRNPCILLISRIWMSLIDLAKALL